MKKYLLGCLMTCVALGFTACSSDDEEEKDATYQDAAYEADAVKYEITSADSEIASVEFTESGNYIITMKGTRAVSGERKGLFGIWNGKGMTRASEWNPYIYGKYTKNGDLYVLNGFGTIEVVKESTVVASLNITPNGQSPYILKAKPLASVNNSDLSRKLCRTWSFDKLESEEINLKTGVSDKVSYTKEQIAQWDLETAGPKEVVITKSGTYLVKSYDNTLSVALWEWVNESEGKFCYSFDGEISDIDRRENIVKVSFNGNNLITEEVLEEGGIREVSRCYLSEVK